LQRTFPIAAPTPLAAIQFRMEQEGLEPRDLEPFIRSRARVSEVLNGERPLSIDMIRALHKNPSIPTEVLIQADPNRRRRPRRTYPSWRRIEVRPLPGGRFGRPNSGQGTFSIWRSPLR
jgi:HTH-type transcriptional regulator/antitoxin HigA